LIALKFSTLFRQLQHHLWKSGETLVYIIRNYIKLQILYYESCCIAHVKAISITCYRSHNISCGFRDAQRDIEPSACIFSCRLALMSPSKTKKPAHSIVEGRHRGKPCKLLFSYVLCRPVNVKSTPEYGYLEALR
jgi:hypothetical protein